MHHRKRLGEMLVEAGVLDATQLQTALAHQRKWGGKLGQALVDLKLASEVQIVAALSRKLGYEVANVPAIQRTPEVEEALKLVPAEVALRHTVLPIASDAGSLTVVMSDPSNIAVVDELAFRTGRRIKISLAGDRVLLAAVQRFYGVVEDDRRRGVAHHGPPSRTAPAPAEPGARPEPSPPLPGRPLTAREAALLDSLQRAVRGEETALVKAPQVAAAIARVLLRKGLLTEAELIDEITKA